MNKHSDKQKTGQTIGQVQLSDRCGWFKKAIEYCFDDVKVEPLSLILKQGF